MKKLMLALCDLRGRFAPQQPASWPDRLPGSSRGRFEQSHAGVQAAPIRRQTSACATAEVPIFAAPVALAPLPKRRQEVATRRADARGNSTLELITRWLRKQP